MVFEKTQKGIVLRVRLTPNSSCCKINGIFIDPNGDEWLKINVISVPEKGKANQELLKFVAAKLKLAKSDLQIISGELDRYKKVLLQADEEKIRCLAEEIN